MSKYGLFHNLPTAGRSDLIFLQACLFESLNIEQALQESSRRLYTLMAPARLTPEIHSVMEDTISAMDSLRKLQKTMNLMFLPNARWSVSTQFASQVNLGGMQMNSKEAKLWDSLVKVFMFFNHIIPRKYQSIATGAQYRKNFDINARHLA